MNTVTNKQNKRVQLALYNKAYKERVNHDPAMNQKKNRLSAIQKKVCTERVTHDLVTAEKPEEPSKTTKHGNHDSEIFQKNTVLYLVGRTQSV